MRDAKEVVGHLVALAQTPDCAAAIRPILKDCLAKVRIVIHTLQSTYRLIRVRRNYAGERFTLVSELSYRPNGVGGFQRANTLATTLFYGASCERQEPGRDAITDYKYGLKVALFESLRSFEKTISTAVEHTISKNSLATVSPLSRLERMPRLRASQ